MIKQRKRETITYFIVELLVKITIIVYFVIIAISVESYERNKTFTHLSHLLRLNNLFHLIKIRSKRLQNQFNKTYHGKYIMYTPLISNGLCNNYIIFITICEFICKVID